MWTCWLIADLSSENPIPSTLCISREYVNLSIYHRSTVWSSITSFFPVPRKYVYLSSHRKPLVWSSFAIAFVCLQWVCQLIIHWLPTPRLILTSIIFFGVQMVCELVGSSQMFDYLIPSSLPILRTYVNLSIARRSLIWPSHSTLFVCLQGVRELANWSQTSHMIIPSHPLCLSPVGA